MRRFQVQPDKTINDSNGNRCRLVMIQMLMGAVGIEDSSRTDWTIRPNNPLGVTVGTGKSPPTGNIPHTYRDYSYISSLIAEYAAKGVGGVRIGVDPAWLNTESYTYQGKQYPADYTVIDSIVDICGRWNMLVNITCVATYAPLSVKQSLAAQVATRYKNFGHVAINPSNEINCGIGTGTCANTTVWQSDMTNLISSIRGTGNLNLIIINGVGSGDQSSSFDIRPLATILTGSAPFTTDPNWCFGVHHYRYIGSASTGWGTTEINQEFLEWGQYLGTIPIIIEETGIHTDVINNYDPNANEPGSSVSLTEWGYAQAHWSGFLSYCRSMMDLDKLCAVSALGDSFWDPSTNWVSDLSLRRGDGSTNTSGTIAFSSLLNITPPPPPGPSWITQFFQNPSSTGGQDINGWNMRILIPGSVFSSSYSKLRITLRPSATQPLNFSSIYLAKRASTGDQYDMDSSITQLTYQTGTTLSMAANSGDHVLDVVTITGSAGQDMILSFGIGGTTWSSYGTPSGFSAMYKSASAANAGVANVTGYTVDASVCPYISKIETMP